MLRISKKADYAVFLLGAIARQGAYPGGGAADAVVSAHEIARQSGLNKSVVANLLKEFAKSGLLESTRGLKGGYRLRRTPADISLADILEVIEGRFVLVDCVAHREALGVGLPSAGQPGDRPTGAATDEPRLLSLAPSMRDGNDRHAADGKAECALMSFCPSKRPMRVVHDRISELFRTIRLDELCSLKAAEAPKPDPALASPR